LNALRRICLREPALNDTRPSVRVWHIAWLEMADEVRYEQVGAAAVLTIDRPAARNAVDGATADALQAGYERFVSDAAARVLVLTGTGGVSFCAGADLKAIDSLTARVASHGGPLGFTRLTSPKPTIAAIEGWCVAGGLELALWCDLRVAAEGSQLGCTERRWGVPLIDGGTQRLPRIVGMGRALDMILSGRLVQTDEALAMGLLTAVVPPGGALARALEMAEGLAAFPQETLLADRLAAIEGFGLALDAGLALEWRHGGQTLLAGQRGARRFADGQGRHGEGSGV
jgi:enoyl-CoA hydratase